MYIEYICIIYIIWDIPIKLSKSFKAINNKNSFRFLQTSLQKFPILTFEFTRCPFLWPNYTTLV